MNSPILVGEDGSGAGLSAVGFEFGVDPNEDPELALVKFIKINLKSERNLLKKSRYKYLKTKSSMVIYKKKIPTVGCRKMVYTVMYIVCKIAFKLQICLHAIYVKCTEMLMCQDLIDFCRLCVCQWRNKEPDRRTKLRRRTLGPPRKQEHSRPNQLEVLVQFIIVPNGYFCVHCLFLCQMLISVSNVYFCQFCAK